jgi:hypothetical protein
MIKLNHGWTSGSNSNGTNVKINFQTSTSTTPSGYLPDSWAVYGDRGNGYTYGWNADNSANARDRDAPNSPNQRYDTFTHMQKPSNPNATWEIAVPNGTYIRDDIVRH